MRLSSWVGSHRYLIRGRSVRILDHDVVRNLYTYPYAPPEKPGFFRRASLQHACPAWSSQIITEGTYHDGAEGSLALLTFPLFRMSKMRISQQFGQAHQFKHLPQPTCRVGNAQHPTPRSRTERTKTLLTLKGITTRSPTFRRATPAPISVTSPMFSCPKTMPGSAAVRPSYLRVTTHLYCSSEVGGNRLTCASRNHRSQR